MGKITTLVLLVASAVFANCFAISKVELAGDQRIDYDDGYEAYAGQFPWFAHIEGYLESNILGIVCGGSIISPNWVMTEAFCGMNPSSWHIYYGATNFTQSSDSTEAIISTNFISHPLFNNPIAWLQNNIGLIELPTSIELSVDVRAITLPWKVVNEQEITAFFIGSRSHEYPEFFSEIRWNFLQIITEEECSKYIFEYDETILCTMGIESNPNQAPCGITDGSTLAYFSNSSWIQVGIGSWPSCRSNAPGQFTRVSTHLDWIASVTGIIN